MGYSSRYHAASLAAVLVALAVGILIGAALGSDVITGTAEDLEKDLGEDLDQLRADKSDLEEDLAAERDFEQQVYPQVVADTLAGRTVALVAVGPVDTQAMSDEVRAAVEPAGAELGEVATLRVPPDTDELIEALRPNADRTIPRGDALTAVARRAGQELLGGEDLGEARGALFASYSGNPDDVTAAIVVRAESEDLSPREQADTELLEEAFVDGLKDKGGTVVAAERADDDPSQIDFFADRGLSSVDNVDTVAGKVALVLVLSGAEGSYGIKDTADSLLPELVAPGGDSARP